MAELRQYRYFVEIARHGSFTAAARSLRVTQSLLSEQVMRLERDLDCRLFDRGRHGARLTPAGEALVSHAEQLLRLSADIERSVGSWGQPRRTQLRVALTVTQILDGIPELLADFERAHEDVEVLVEDVDTAEAFLRVNTGRLDVGIVSVSDAAFEAQTPAGISVTKLLEEDFVLLVPADHRLAAFDRVPLAQLRDERTIVFLRSSALRRVTNELLERENVSVRDTIESGRLDIAVRMVGVGLGVCLLPRTTAILAEAADTRVVELDAADPPKRLLLALHRDDSPNAELGAALVQAIQARIAATIAGDPALVAAQPA